MDFIRALQQAAPATSSVGVTAVPSSTDISEVSVQQAQGALAASGENNSTTLDANEVSGGLSHFIEAEHFLSRTMQLVSSTLELCGRVRAKKAIHTVRASKEVLILQYRSSVREEESTGEKSDSAKLISPTRKEREGVSDETDKLCTPESIYRTYTSIKDSVSAVAFCVATLEIYQSQPMLLDQHLLDIVQPLSHTVANNLDLLTPLSVSELRAELSAILSQLSRALSSNSPVHPEASSSSISSSSSSTRPSLPASTCSASASSAATSSSAALCGPSYYNRLSLEGNCSSVVNPIQSSVYASLPPANESKPADTCMRTTNSSFVNTSEPHCSPGNTKRRLMQQLEDLYLRTAATLALRLLMHLLYVVSRVRGYKHLRQLLPSEPELLEVVVDHCEQLLDAEFLQPLRAAPPPEPCSPVVADTLPVVPVTEAPASYEELHQSDGRREVLSSAATRDPAGEGECAGDPDRENVFFGFPEHSLVQQTQQLLELLQQLPLWSTHYYLLVWLSLLVLAPFDLKTLDSSGSAASHIQQPAAGTVVPPSCGRLEEKTRERMRAGEELEEEVLEKIGERNIVRYYQQPLGWRIIVLVEGYLRRTSSKASDAAAFVVARFFSRPDVSTKAAGTLSAFLQFCQDVLDDGSSSTEGSAALLSSRCRVPPSVLENTADSIPLFAKANALRAVNEILKNISRESALPELPRLLHLLDIRRETPSTSLVAAGPVESAGSQQQEITDEEKKTGNAAAATRLENAARSALFRKLRCSCAARICMVLLPPVGSEAYQWRYTAHARNLEAHLKQSQQQMLQQQTSQQQGIPVDDRESTADSVSKAFEHRSLQHEVHEEDVPDAVEEVINLLLESLADRDTIVRWAAAKAIGRIVLQLRQSLASQVVGSILENLEIDTPYRAASAERLWHGSCLALGELLRRGLVNPEEHLHACATRLCFALSLDTSEGVSCAHGSGYMTSATATAEQLRDAACFAVWSLARAYYHRTEEVKQQVGRLSKALLLVALFDREVNCRRAAAAAFQELEGRHGGIPHGLQIVTTADFFALATRRSAYLKVAPQVAALDSFYCIFLLDTLMKLLLQQSDREMRTLAAAAIKRIAALRERCAVQQYMKFLLKKAIGERENLTTRHGALLGLTALLESLENSVGKKSSETTAAPARETALREERGAPETAMAPTSDTCSTSLRSNNSKAEDWYKEEENSSLLEDKLQTSLRQLVITIEKQRLYRGKGGDMIRTAVCRFIQALTTSEYIFFKHATARRYTATLMEGLRHFSDCVQLAAAEALRALLRLRLSREEVLQEVVPELLQRLQNPSENVAARRGYALALATLPEDVYRSLCSSPFQQQDSSSVEPLHFLEFLQTEAVSFAPLGRPSLGDAQTRRNALIALAFALGALLTSPLWTAAAKRKHEGGLLPGTGDSDAALEGRLEPAEIHTFSARNAETVKGEQSEAVKQTCHAETVKTPVATGAASSFGPAAARGSCAIAAGAPAAGQTTRPAAFSAYEVRAAREEDLERGKKTVDTYEMTEDSTSGHVFKTSSRILESICSTLESCSVDYQVDKRGDVGSWVREVAAEVATFLLENPHIACYRSCSCIFAGQTGSEQAALGHNKDSEVTDVRKVDNEDQNCVKARLFSLLLRLSLENLDRTRSRAVFLLYHLVAPLPASCFHTLSAKTFKVEWMWSRVFYDFSYEAVLANLIPRPDLLRADPSPCLAMPSQGRTGTQQGPWAAARKTTGAAGLTSALTSAEVTMTRCASLVAMLQHVLVPLAEEQTNALESVMPRMPFHNLNLSEFAVINASSRLPSAGGFRGKRGGGAGTVTGAQIDEDLPRRSAADGDEDTATATFEAVSSLGHQSGTKGTVIETIPGSERLAKELQDTEEVENTEQMDFTLVNNKSSFDFLLELSVGDGGRASLHKTRKAGVLLRLPLFTDPAVTYPRLLLALMMPPPFSYAAAQGLCLGVGALTDSTSDRAAHALLRFLTNLRHAGDARGDGAAITLDKQAALVNLQQTEITEERRARSTQLLSSGAGKRTKQQEAAVDLLSEFRSVRLLWKGEAVVREVGSLVVNVLEDSANEPTGDACKREARSDLHSDKMCLAALKTVALISGFLSKDEISRVMGLLLKTLDDGVWRKSYQYAKARCEAFIALLAAGWSSTPSVCLYNGITKETVDKAAAETQNSCKTYKKALCAVLQYLTHSFPKLRQLAAEELYASLLLPLSATHGRWSHCETARHTDSTAPTEKVGAFARGCQKPAISPQFLHTARQIEDASQVVIKTPWMEICTNDTEPVERLVDLFELRVEWDEVVDKKGRD